MKIKHSLIIVTMLAGACSGLGGIKALDKLPGKNVLGNMGVNNPLDIKKPDLVKNVDLSRAIGAAKDLTKAMTVSDDDVKAMALKFSQYADSKNKVATDSSRYAKRLKRLVAKHLREDGLNLNFKVYMSPDVNAFSMADGTVRIYSGLMDIMRDQELLAVIGHEIAHVKLGHSLSKMKTAMLASAARKGAASMSSTVGALAESEIGGLFQKVITSQFSQAKEHESDTYALKFLLTHGYEGQGAVNAMYKLASIQEKSGSEGAGVLSTHPGPRERAKRLARLLEEAKSNPSVLTVAIPSQPSSPSQPTQVSRSVESVQTAMPAVAQAVPRVATAASAIAVPAAASVASKVNASSSTATLQTAAPVQAMKAAPVMAKAPSSGGLASGYYLQSSAETDEALAKRKVALLKSEGMKVVTQRAVVKGKVYIRILVGPYSTSLEAQKQSSFVIMTGLNDGSPFVKRIR